MEQQWARYLRKYHKGLSLFKCPSPPRFNSPFIIDRCGSEYMDIYTEVQSSDAADLINSPFSGRYCGPVPPRRRVSLYRAVALSFYTNKNVTTPDVFTGSYTFINECKVQLCFSGSTAIIINYALTLSDSSRI